MASNKSKLFRDPVHGYIAVPEAYCDAFIDTPIFQRLRSIEQTSMRPLYPSARHDRFSHSLGVFHLATRIFPFLKANSQDCAQHLGQRESSFLVAALMHDCAHAPFSHILEAYYQRQDIATNFLLDEVDDASFLIDYKALQLALPKAHEIFSAAIFLRHYRDAAEGIGADPLLVARMITGCVHSGVNPTQEQQIENCLIMLINSSSFDIDKLDYIMRDTWASGVNNTSIDVLRVLSSIGFRPARNKLMPVFSKSSLSVVQSVLLARDFLHLWIYGHHTVVYFTDLIQKAVQALDSSFQRTFGQELLPTIFSKDVFETTKQIGHYSFYLPTDGDILYLLKEFRSDIPEVDQILSRQPSLVPLWKTRAEFDVIFGDPDGLKTSKIHNALPSHLLQYLELPEENVLRLWVNPTISLVEKNILIEIDHQVRTLATVNHVLPRQELAEFFYAYIPRQYEDRVPECRAKLTEAAIY